MIPCTTRLSTRSRTRRAGSLAAVLGMMLMLAPPQAFAQKPTKRAPLNVIPISITSVNVVNGALVANGVVGSTAFSQPITLTPLTQPTDGSCPVLDLSLGPIHLSLLGLNVDTSAICLKITAHQGQGLLGDILCSIGQQLNLGVPLSTILAALTPDQLDTLNSGLTSLLNTVVFTPLTSSSALAGVTCPVLNLTLGPLDLTLLGLEVHLDNCQNGPVTLDITATQNGGLLGNLLCSLAGQTSNSNSPLTGILARLQTIITAIGQLIG